jgi:hypothetical protein
VTLEAAAIAREIAPLVAREIERLRSEHRIDGLWSLAKIAGWCEVSERKARDIVATAGFPVALRLPSEGAGLGHPRWYATEVIQWWADRR